MCIFPNDCFIDIVSKQNAVRNRQKSRDFSLLSYLKACASLRAIQIYRKGEGG